MSVLKKAVGVIVGAAALLVPLTVTAQPADAATRFGCPRGDVCLYPEGKDFRHSTPSKKYYHYGVYNLHGVTGRHWLFNNQWGGAYVIAYYGPNATGKCFGFNTNGVSDWNWGPIDSIRLSTYLPARCEWSG